MYKLIYKSQFAAGFDADQIVGNLAQLLQLKPKTVRLVFLSERPSVIKILESSAEVEQWRAAFLEAGVHLDVVSMTAPDADSIADQIELELELHSLDDDAEDEVELPRQLLVKKVVVREDEQEQPAADIIATPTPAPVAEPKKAKKSAAARAATEKTATAQSTPAKPEILSADIPAESTPIAIDHKPESVNPKKARASAKPAGDDKSAKTDLNVKPTVNSESGVDAEAIATSDVKTKSKPRPKPKTETKITAEAKTASDVNADADADIKPGPETAPENNQQEAVLEDDHVDVDFHKSSFLWGMLVILLAIVLTASVILWLKRPLWAPVTAAPQTEVVNALATESLFALAHVDVPRLQQLPGVLQSAADMDNLPAPVENFWRNLEQAGIAIVPQLDQVWIAAYRANNQTQSLWVLTGKFNAEEIRSWLKKNYVIDEDSPQQLVFSMVDENTCEKQPAMMAIIESGRILLGAPERVAAFRGRLEASAPAGLNLADWQALSAKQMLSMALFNPVQSGEAASAIALTKLSVDAAQVKGIYVGVAPHLLPPMLEFNAVMVGANQEFIDTAERNIAPLLANVKTTIARDWPETLPIYERMKLSKSAQQLRASVFFDEKIHAQLELWGSSLLARTFAMSDSPVEIAQERLDERPRAFSNLPSSGLPDFASSKHLNPSFLAQTTTGPFGVEISSIDATDQGVVITLDVNAFNLPNLGKAADSIQLRITDIVDHQDQSLLATSGCDATGARQLANINMVYEGAYFEQGQPVPYVGIQGTKKIRLPDTINISNIGAIKGELSYKLPVEVERVKVDMPLAGKVVNTHGLQLRFLTAGPSRLYFQRAGNSDALLQINALNAAGKVLAPTNVMQGANPFAAGAGTSIDVQGSVAAAEVIVASKLEEQIYPFSFGRIQPPEKTFVQEKPAPELLTAATLTALKQDTPPEDIKYPYQTPQQTIIAGPALIALNQLNIQAEQLTLMADIYLRNQHPLTRQLSAARFVITEVEDSAGDIHSVNYQAPIALEHSGGFWADGKYQPDPTQPWVRGQLDLRGQELGVSDVIAFWGKLVFLAVDEPVTIQLPFQFGMQWNGADSALRLARWEAGRLLFDIEGSFPELMAITALDDSGAVVSQAAELRSNLGVNQVELPVKQRPAMIEFSLARNQKTAEFPFEIRAQQ